MFNDLENASKETIRLFYKNELGLSYTRCKRYSPPVKLNYKTLA